MYQIFTFPFYVLFFYFMILAALMYWPLILFLVILGIIVMIFPAEQ